MATDNKQSTTGFAYAGVIYKRGGSTEVLAPALYDTRIIGTGLNAAEEQALIEAATRNTSDRASVAALKSFCRYNVNAARRAGINAIYSIAKDTGVKSVRPGNVDTLRLEGESPQYVAVSVVTTNGVDTYISTPSISSEAYGTGPGADEIRVLTPMVSCMHLDVVDTTDCSISNLRVSNKEQILLSPAYKEGTANAGLLTGYANASANPSVYTDEQVGALVSKLDVMGLNVSKGGALRYVAFATDPKRHMNVTGTTATFTGGLITNVGVGTKSGTNPVAARGFNLPAELGFAADDKLLDNAVVNTIIRTLGDCILGYRQQVSK